MKPRYIPAILLLMAAVSFAQAPAAPANPPVTTKEAWQMTDDERIATRLDPENIRQRAVAHSAAMMRLHGSSVSSMSMSSPEPPAFVIVGAENPELFLPFELFGQLLRGVDPKLTPTDRQVARALLEERIKTFGFDPDVFWVALGSSTTKYFATRDGVRGTSAGKHIRAQANPSPSVPDDGQITQCRERLAALNSAREHFARENFDRFLYTVVAPTLTLASAPPGPDEASGLRFLAGGCR